MRIGRTSPLRVAAVGEGLIELGWSDSDHARVTYGGDTLNTAIYMARLLGPGAVEYLTALGRDEFSERLLAAWAAEGVGVGHVRRLADRLPGLYWVMTDEQGERRFHYWRHESAARSMMSDGGAGEIARALLGRSLVYFSGISLAILPPTARAALLAALDAARRAGALIAFDSNYRPRLWEDGETARRACADALRLADIALVSASDEAELCGDASPSATAERLRAAGVQEVVVKNQAAACIIVCGGEHLRGPPPVAVDPVDTTAAGDSFNAAYLCARLEGCAPSEAAARGQELAGIVVRHRGAIVPRGATDPVRVSCA